MSRVCSVALLCAVILFIGSVAVSAVLAKIASIDPARVEAVVVHLRDRRDREANVAALTRAAEVAGVKISVEDAIDGRSCGSIDVHPFNDFAEAPGSARSHLRGGEQGCLASFLSAIAKCDGGLCYMEDDAIISARHLGEMARLLVVHAEEPMVLHTCRVYPIRWPNLAQTRREEESSKAHPAPGWRRLRAPNYSTACFALTAAALRELRQWLRAISARGAHKVPTDDLLSLASDCHPGRYAAPMLNHWHDLPRGPLHAYAPAVGISSQMRSSSDTERQASRPGPCGVAPRHLDVA
jgi:hypothetical protein